MGQTKWGDRKKFGTVIIGATFSAIGLAMKLGEECLVVEPGPVPGHDFVECLNPGTNWGAPLRTERARRFRDELLRRNALTADGRVHLPGAYALLCERIHRVPRERLPMASLWVERFRVV
jgi:hypothetical protein